MSSTFGRPSFEIPSHVLLREVDGEMVLLNLDSEQYYGLDVVGARILTALTTKPRPEALAALQKDYDVDAARLGRDVDELVARLLDVGLLAPLDSS